MKNIHFIINPIAGHGNNKITKDLLSKHFEKNEYTFIIKYSNYKKHAKNLTHESLKEGADIIVACGGDGTINEVASCLVNTSTTLGIIPFGSGNGLASNLNIPKNIEKAITLIKQEHVKKIDVGKINNSYFFSNTGVGFDACVIKNYESSTRRRLSSYILASVKSFKELNRTDDVEIIFNNELTLKNPFMIFVSNSNELGYNMSLTPKASLQDGLLDVLIIPKLSKVKILALALLMLIKKHHLLKEVKYYQLKHIELKTNTEGFQSQIDGDFREIVGKSFTISVQHQCLNVIT